MLGPARWAALIFFHPSLPCQTSAVRHSLSQGCYFLTAFSLVFSLYTEMTNITYDLLIVSLLWLTFNFPSRRWCPSTLHCCNIALFWWRWSWAYLGSHCGSLFFCRCWLLFSLACSTKEWPSWNLFFFFFNFCPWAFCSFPQFALSFVKEGTLFCHSYICS